VCTNKSLVQRYVIMTSMKAKSRFAFNVPDTSPQCLFVSIAAYVWKGTSLKREKGSLVL
jgi:hypothetical protein